METTQNRFSKTVSKIEKTAGPLSQKVVSFAIGRAIRFAGTAGLQVEELSPNKAVASIANRKRVQNHIGGVHAAAMVLVAENTTGLVVGMNVPDTAVPVVKSLKVDFVKRATGSLRAEATLTDEQCERIRTEPKGDVTVNVRVTDEAGVEPIQCEIIWAWTPKRR